MQKLRRSLSELHAWWGQKWEREAEATPQGEPEAVTIIGICPACHQEFDIATKGGRETKGVPGDLSLCVYCEAALVVGEGGKLELLGSDRWEGLEEKAKKEFLRICDSGKDQRISIAIARMKEGLKYVREEASCGGAEKRG